MAKLILDNPHYEDTASDHCDKPFYIKVSPKIWSLVEKYSCDLSSEICDMYLSDTQKSMLSQRAKNFYITTWLPKVIVKDILDNLDCCLNYAFIVHDCDKYEDGSLKKTHCHIILQLTTNYSYSKIAVEFHTVDFRRLGDTWYNEYNYLTHNSELCRKQGKYQYNEDDIISNNILEIKRKAVKQSEEFTEEDIVNDILDGMSTRNLLRLYGRRFSSNRKNLYDVVNAIRFEEHIPIMKKVLKCSLFGDDLVQVFYNDGTSELILKNKLLLGVDYNEE